MWILLRQFITSSSSSFPLFLFVAFLSYFYYSCSSLFYSSLISISSSITSFLLLSSWCFRSSFISTSSSSLFFYSSFSTPSPKPCSLKGERVSSFHVPVYQNLLLFYNFLWRSFGLKYSLFLYVTIMEVKKVLDSFSANTIENLVFISWERFETGDEKIVLWKGCETSIILVLW